jgi:hypothetical protein
MAAGQVKKARNASSGRWLRASKSRLRGRVTKVATQLDGQPWPHGVTRAVKVDGKLYPARRVAVTVTGSQELTQADVVRFFERINLHVEQLKRLGTPAVAGTVERMPNTQIIKTSDTPPADVLAGYTGQWVAMAAGKIIDHDESLVALGERLRESGTENDRLFRVPEDLSAPAPATLG